MLSPRDYAGGEDNFWCHVIRHKATPDLICYHPAIMLVAKITSGVTRGESFLFKVSGRCDLSHDPLQQGFTSLRERDLQPRSQFWYVGCEAVSRAQPGGGRWMGAGKRSINRKRS
ncbi:hypothetical protein RRG08_003562 [Elysia crispata]|uniref:Uncharacterized protein n=1 Tax=Elysia crispata TaxID=231223 RepID=A0AAE0Y7H5_9GAST|nr:hypothetical protein RRG08_003562 [Elysia crispata]